MGAASVGRAEFKTVCRRWRHHRKLSQLELALAAGVSQRHLSWLETGRSRPSREMVIRLSEAMEVPLRERNALLEAAGFSSVYGEKALDEPDMQPVLEALRRMLDHHEPFPAVVVDRAWSVRMQNRAAGMLVALGADIDDLPEAVGGGSEPNLALLTLHPQGLRPHIANWDRLAPSFVGRLRSEALAAGDPDLQERFEAMIELAGPLPESREHEGLLPVLPLELAFGTRRLRLFTVITTLGTPQDVTTDELRLEAFLPADAATERFLRDAAAAASDE